MSDGSVSWRIRSMPGLMAWISLCLLAAAWGSTLAPGLQMLWGKLGLFGLIAAVGLEAAEKSQQWRKERERRAVLQGRVEQKLGRFRQQCASIEVIRAAVHRVNQDAQKRAATTAEGRSDSRQLFIMPVKVMPLPKNPENARVADLETYTAYTRDISNRGVGLLHNKPLQEGLVLLTFDLLGGEPISFVTQITWCRRESEDRYAAGGEILEAAAPVSPTPQDLPHAENPAQPVAVADDSHV